MVSVRVRDWPNVGEPDVVVDPDGQVPVWVSVALVDVGAGAVQVGAHSYAGLQALVPDQACQAPAFHTGASNGSGQVAFSVR